MVTVTHMPVASPHGALIPRPGLLLHASFVYLPLDVYSGNKLPLNRVIYGAALIWAASKNDREAANNLLSIS